MDVEYRETFLKCSVLGNIFMIVKIASSCYCRQFDNICWLISISTVSLFARVYYILNSYLNNKEASFGRLQVIRLKQDNKNHRPFKLNF